jgi:hypothetical protein
MDSVIKIKLAIDYHVEEWLLPALNSLVQRAEPMDIDDANRLGVDYTLKIAAIRECCIRDTHYGGWSLKNSRGAVGIDCTNRLREVFRL